MGTYPTILALAAPCSSTCPTMTLQPSNAATPASLRLLRRSYHPAAPAPSTAKRRSGFQCYQSFIEAKRHAGHLAWE